MSTQRLSFVYLTSILACALHLDDVCLYADQACIDPKAGWIGTGGLSRCQELALRVCVCLDRC